jgi:nitrous oxidase accessory protein NosD
MTKAPPNPVLVTTIAVCLALIGCACGGGSGAASDGGAADHPGGDAPGGGDGGHTDGPTPDGAGPCAGVTCSDHGQCAVVGGAAVCQCDSGYHAAGLACEEDDVDCAAANVRCVDDTPGPTQEYATIQAAVDDARAGDLVLVFDGSYAGFQVTTSGGPGAPLVVRAQASGAVIDADGPTGDGIRLENVSHVTIAGFHIVGVTDRGLAHRGATPEAPVHGLIIRGNTIQDSGTEGMYLSEVADSLVEGNTITGAGASGADRTHGIYLANAGSKGTTLRGNVISGSGTAGIHFNGDLSVGGDGIISGLVVEENVIFDNGQNGLNLDGVQDSVIRNNVIHGNAENGIRAYAIDGAAGPKGLVIVNNTIHVPAGAGWCVRITEDGATNVVFNNILINEDADNGSIALDATAGFQSANNAVVDSFTPDRDDTYLTLAEWQALGYDSGSFVATAAALFTDAASGDYVTKAGAPAVGAGLLSFAGHAAPTTDIRGNARTAPVDVGAYEQ